MPIFNKGSITIFRNQFDNVGVNRDSQSTIIESFHVEIMKVISNPINISFVKFSREPIWAKGFIVLKLMNDFRNFLMGDHILEEKKITIRNHLGDEVNASNTSGFQSFSILRGNVGSIEHLKGIGNVM